MITKRPNYQNLYIITIVIIYTLNHDLLHAAYPDKSIRIIVPFSAGGNIDSNARIIAVALSDSLGQPIIIDNRAGAGGRIGMVAAAKAPPDGYTALLGSSGMLTMSPAFFPSVIKLYSLNDFIYTTTISTVPLVLIIHPSIPISNVKDFINLAKNTPHKFSMSSAGIGSTTHIAGELFQINTKIKLTHIPYKGGHPALIDLVSGQVNIMFDQISTSSTFIKNKKLRALGIATLNRSVNFPNIPTIHESGVHDFEASTYSGLVFPAKTPQDRVDIIYRSLLKILDSPFVIDNFTKGGAEVIKSNPDDFLNKLQVDLEKWTKLSITLNLKLE